MEANNNLKALAYVHKSSKVDKVFAYISAFFLIIAGILFSVIFRIIEVYIVCVIITLLGFLFLILILIENNQTKKTKDEIILYDELNKKLIINKYGKDYVVSIDDIKEIKYRNKEIKDQSFIIPIFSIEKTDHGNLIFILNDNKRIKTLRVKDVLNVYNMINDLMQGLSLEYYGI